MTKFLPSQFHSKLEGMAEGAIEAGGLSELLQRI
jgi:hypothetical protein